MPKTLNLDIRGRLVDKISALDHKDKLQPFRLALTPEQKLVEMVTHTLKNSTTLQTSMLYPVRIHSMPVQTLRNGLVISSLPTVVLEQEALEQYVIIRPKDFDLHHIEITYLNAEDLARYARLCVSDKRYVTQHNAAAKMKNGIGIEGLASIVDSYASFWQYGKNDQLPEEAASAIALFLTTGRIPYVMLSSDKVRKGDHVGYVTINSDTYALEGEDEVIKQARARFDNDEVGRLIEERDEQRHIARAKPLRAYGESEVRIASHSLERYQKPVVESSILNEIVQTYLSELVLEVYEQTKQLASQFEGDRRKKKSPKKGDGGVLSDLS